MPSQCRFKSQTQGKSRQVPVFQDIVCLFKLQKRQVVKCKTIALEWVVSLPDADSS